MIASLAATTRPHALPSSARGGMPHAAPVHCSRGGLQRMAMGMRMKMQAPASSVKDAPAPSPALDLNALWEEHVATEFTEKSADAAVGTMVPHATVNHVPTMTGGVGTEALRSFYAKHFIPRMPEDVKLTPIDRTIAKDTVVDEFIFEFTHNVQMDWMLPGLQPTGKKVRVPFVAVVKFEGSKLRAERIYWDQATVLVQLGLLSPQALPCVTGAEQAIKQADLSSLPSNTLIKD